MEHDTNGIFDIDLRARTAGALAGAVVGGTAGMAGGVEAMGLAGILGAIAGLYGGSWLERRTAEIDRAEVVPEIEPPCPDCVTARELANDPSFTCAAHRPHRHGHSLLHYEYPQGFGTGSSVISVT